MFIIRRPAVWVAIILLLLYTGFFIISGEEINHKQYIFDDLFENNDKIQTTLSGEFVSSQQSANSVQIVLKDVRLKFGPEIENNLQEKYLPAIVIYVKNLSNDFKPGNILVIKASLLEIKPATNPGEFDIKKYYCEKKIYYRAICNEYDIYLADNKINYIKSYALSLRNKIKNVYIKCLPVKEAGTISAMLLGDKSMLDEEVKELYRQNGISHLLAISGLHVTILCMALMNFLLKIRLNEKLSIIIISIFLIIYGIMTGFGISTSRAVIMMIFALITKINGRSYDMLSAMAASAVIIVIQRPSALFSCSFLLSYGAIIAISVLYPFLLKLLINDEKSMMHFNNEGIIHYFIVEIKCSILMSFSIQIFTLPIILYYYYETSTFATILNIIVLPLSEILVIIGALAGIIGVFFIPFGKFLLGGVYIILNIYETACEIFQKLPLHTIVTGRPELYKIIIFYAGVFICIYFFDKIKEINFLKKVKISGFYSAILSFSYKFKNINLLVIPIFVSLIIFIMFPQKNSTFSISFLDVGQGDCILIRSESGKVYMVDCGSSSKEDIAKYIVSPYLKYNGITKIDYFIMTHSDNDHISGVIEFLKQHQSDKSIIKNFMLPNPDNKLKDETYNEVLKLAKINCDNVGYIKKFDFIEDGDLKILCVHPENKYNAESANAYSTVLSIKYKNESVLLTGDIEKDGEKQVIETLNQYKNIFPETYTVLKAAHHGSKYTTSDEFLQCVNPIMTVISCGKNNHYGHPHKETLERLRNNGTKTFITYETGAVILRTEGTKLVLERYLKN